MSKMVTYLKETHVEMPDLYAVYCSATTCSESLWKSIVDTLHISELITGYGMTEVCRASMQTKPYDDIHVHATRVGRILDGGVSGLSEYNGRQLEYKVIDPETLEELPRGICGELICRGLTVITEYYIKTLWKAASDPSGNHSLALAKMRAADIFGSSS